MAPQSRIVIVCFDSLLKSPETGELNTSTALHVVCFIRNVVKMCTVAIFRFCTVVSYFFSGILDSRFLVIFENM